MIANIRINLNIPDNRGKAALARENPGMVGRWNTDNQADREEIGAALEEWVKDEMPRLLEGDVSSYEVEVDW